MDEFFLFKIRIDLRMTFHIVIPGMSRKHRPFRTQIVVGGSRGTTLRPDQLHQGVIGGLPELPVSNIAFKDSRFTARKGAEVHFAENITFDNVIVNGKAL